VNKVVLTAIGNYSYFAKPFKKIQMPKYLFFIFCFVANAAVAQHSIGGKITDSNTGEAMAFATVYINGTTNGTISNNKGEFILENFDLPCKVIVSHVGYHTYEINCKEGDNLSLSIALKPRATDISEVFVPEKNKREENLILFRQQFLGMDKWGEKARILNENVLEFLWTYETIQSKDYGEDIKRELLKRDDVKWANDSSWVEYDFPLELKVKAHEALKVELPALGYTVHVDLLDFSYAYNKKPSGYMCGYIGYFYYQPDVAKRITNKVLKNRNDVWYHSRQHFGRALCSHQLEANGYRLLKEERKAFGEKSYHRVQLDSLIIMENGIYRLCGLNQQKFHLLYFQNRKGKPINLEEKKGKQALQSEIYFLSDTCLIRPDGVTPDNNIVFSPLIGAKKLGASLPADFSPDN
jgi:hypothetical protein